jgi:hypothetical protein
MHKNAMKCNETLSKWCKNKYGASKIIDTFERYQRCDRLVHLLTLPFCLFNPLDGKTLRAQTLFQKTYCKPPLSSTRYREGPKALPGTLPERGITTGGLLHHHACLRSDV